MADLTRSDALYERAQLLIPGGIPGIRAPENFVPGAYPKLLAGGRGGHVTDADGNDYVDLLLGYGPIVVGHGEREIDEAAAERARSGFCLNLPGEEMIHLAERLVMLVPSAEQALFFKTGSDATSAAVRIARAHTGRSLVLRCGYHGWHDWCLAGDPGVPAAATAQVQPFDYNDLAGLEAQLAARPEQVAAIVLTPVGHDFDAQIEPPADGFLAGARRLADEHGAVLVFDEVRTGFRVDLGGAQALYGVTPDLTALGKAMANGYAVTALVGRAEVMESARDTFISSTYFPNSLEMAAALRTLDLLEREDVLGALQAAGTRLRAELEEVAARRSLPVTLSPYPTMPFLHFGAEAELRDRFYGRLAEAGVFAHPRHHGFLCWRHDEADLARVVETADRAAAAL